MWGFSWALNLTDLVISKNLWGCQEVGKNAIILKTAFWGMVRVGHFWLFLAILASLVIVGYSWAFVHFDHFWRPVAIFGYFWHFWLFLAIFSGFDIFFGNFGFFWLQWLLLAAVGCLWQPLTGFDCFWFSFWPHFPPF